MCAKDLVCFNSQARQGKHVIQVSHGIVLPVKLHYQS